MKEIFVLERERFQKQLRKRWEKVVVGVCKWQGLGLTVLYFLKLTSEGWEGGKGEESRAGSNGLKYFLEFAPFFQSFTSTINDQEQSVRGQMER